MPLTPGARVLPVRFFRHNALLIKINYIGCIFNMRSALVILLSVIFCCTGALGQRMSNDDILSIKKGIEKKRVIGLGEEEHFFHGSNVNRIEIIKELLKDNMIQAIVFETPGTDAFVVNEYVHNRIDKPDLLKALNQFKALNGGPFFDSNELLSFFDWVKKRIAGGKNIEIYGMDFYNYIAALENLRKAQKGDGIRGMLDRIKIKLDTLSYFLHKDPAQLASEETRKTSAENLRLVQELLAKSDTSLSPLARCSARDLYSYAYWFTDLNSRDSMMFQNFSKVDDHSKNYLIWAANFHIQNDSLSLLNFTSYLFGNFMAKKYGNDYFKIGVFGKNPCGQNNAERVFSPALSCGIKSGFDLILLIEKGNRTSSAIQ